MQGVFIVILCCVFYEITAQTTAPSQTTASLPPQSNCEDFTTSQQEFQESPKFKRNKFSCVLNLLKNALAEELQNSYFLTENTAQNNDSSNDRNNDKKQILEENETQIEKPILEDENKTEIKNEYHNAVTKPTRPYSNLTNEKKAIEMPNMIPIFKPRPKSEPIQNVADFSSSRKKQGSTSKSVAFIPEKIIQASPIPNQIETNQYAAVFSSSPLTTNSRQISNSRPVSFVPEKIVQTNMNPIPNHAMFNIPCQRAVDVLDMGIDVPKEVIFRNAKGNLIADTGKSFLPNQVPVAIDKRHEDDTVAMLFKPKNISLEQVYGNLLKKITITVLVPYHMSKLGGKPAS